MNRFQIFKIWLIISIMLGIALSFIRWGSLNAFHGQGFPIPVVLWDRSPVTGEFIPYESYLGFLLNPLLVFVVGLACWAHYILVRALWKRWKRREL